ncbi:transposase [Moorena sp. SIO3I6]|uniref:RNA-guided endonuclease InsQ/TnpB family protein n=1 Tax=Moorena sp. SIO3I6 TaxID=2607831 RepID=UPI0025FAA062|nr:transposase [Moorena sp. SIO3I6]
MLLNYQYQAYPSTQQKLELNDWLRICRYWYNWQLGDRFRWWNENRTAVNSCPLITYLPELRDNPGYFSQKKLLPIWKKDLVTVVHSGELLDFTRVPANTLQDVCKRADLAFSRFIKGDCNGSRSGKPRFKNQARYRTLKIDGKDCFSVARIERKWIWLKISKLKGWLKVRLHRPLPDGFKIKNILITKKTDGWYTTLCLEDSTVPAFTPESVIPTWDNGIGLDAVLYGDDYLATSENTKLPSLKSYRKNHSYLVGLTQIPQFNATCRVGKTLPTLPMDSVRKSYLEKVQTKKNAKTKGSKARRKLQSREARIHQRIARSRKDHAYKTAHVLVRTGKKVFYYENLNLTGLNKRNKPKPDGKGGYLPNGQSAKSGLNKSWLDAGFGQFFEVLDYIAGKAGAVTKKCNPAYTSQLLSYRDEFVFTDCDLREYWDEQEMLLVDRDINAAINLKRVGLGVFPTIKRAHRESGYK